MKKEVKDVTIENRLAAAEFKREKQILDRILSDIDKVEEKSVPQVETKAAPKLVLVYG